MVGTKIFVFRLREVIKTALIGLAAVAVILLLVWFFTSDKDGGQTAYIPGTYTAQLSLRNEPVTVEVTVTENEITSIDLLDMSEVQEVFYPLVKPAFAELSEQILSKQTTKIKTSEEQPVTSQLLLEAIDNALVQAMPAESE